MNFLKIELSDKYNNLVKILSSQIGSLINVHELTNTLGLNRLTGEKYISTLKATFIVFMVLPFYKNIRSEISKMSKIYFNDTGLRNSNIDSFGEVDIRPDRGELIENFIYTQLKVSKFLRNVRFWRTKTGGEVDFVAEFGKVTIAFESKFSSFVKPSFSRSLRHFVKDYKPEKIIIFTKNYLKKVEKEEFEYSFKHQKQTERDKFEDEKVKLKKEMQVEKETFEKELAEREAKIAEKEDELNNMRDKVNSFPKELEATVHKAVKETL